MKRLLCLIFGHKWNINKTTKNNNGTILVKEMICDRCGEKQKGCYYFNK